MNTFEYHNILGWVMDDFDQINEAVKSENYIRNYNDYLNEYKEYVYDSDVALLYESAPFKLNLGGETEKSKLVTTDKPTGIFDFSLASRGLYRVPEYYSQRLAEEKPDRFEGYDLPKGVVPPTYIKQTNILGNNIYKFIDGSEEYECVIRQKGETAIEQNIKNARLKFATRNRKVYLTYKRNRGKVKYVEIYSLFYYTSLAGNLQFAIRHIPAMMVADYLESIGIKVRFYMTRFVDLGYGLPLREKVNGLTMPMYEKSQNRDGQGLFIQPIIAKDFAQDFDKASSLLISSSSYNNVYKSVAKYALKKETTAKDPQTGGNPDWCQNDYFEGFERYRNKYQEYVKLGIFKSKEVTSDAMLFFHDMVIKTRFESFAYSIQTYVSKSDAESLIDPNINPFFVWWMRTSANVLKHKVNILNSDDYKKDLAEIEKDLLKTIDELEVLLKYVTPLQGRRGMNLRKYLEKEGYQLIGETEGVCIGGDGALYGYNIVDNSRQLTFRTYIINIASEITTYAIGGLYETSDEQKEYRDGIFNGVLDALSNFSYTK